MCRFAYYHYFFLVSSTSLLNLEFCLYYTQCICVHFMGFFSMNAPFMKYFLFVECVSFHSFKNLLVIKKEQLIYMCISQLFVWMFSIYKVTKVFVCLFKIKLDCDEECKYFCLKQIFLIYILWRLQ